MTTLDLPPGSVPLLANGRVCELASGVDAFYFSGFGEPPESWLAELERLQGVAFSERMPQPVTVGGAEFMVQSHGWRQYTFLLTHPYGRIGVTASEQFPAFRVQPLAVALHGLGAAEAVGWFEAAIRSVVVDARFTASRVDLYCDVQGWVPTPESRHDVVCRSRNVVTYEVGGVLTGFELGKRKTAGVVLRVYDKTRQVWDQGLDYWYPIWGDRFDPVLPVWRIELEFGRKALRQYGADFTEDVFPRLAGMWASATTDLYRLCEPTADQTPSRWRTHPAWEAIQIATLRADAVPIERLKETKREGSLRMLQAPLSGILSSIGALRPECRTLDDLLDAAFELVEDYERWTSRSIMERVEEKRRR